MSLHWSLVSIFISIILFQISYIHSTPILSESTSRISDENEDGYQRAHTAFIYLIKNLVDEPNPYERTVLLNQLRENLNRMCINGYFGASHADACQRVVGVIHQTHVNNHINDDDNSDTSNEPRAIQKRFFCNGFTGCKNVNFS